MGQLSGKAAMVTGASRGIGAAIAERLARDGAAVAITYVHGRDKADEVVKRIEGAGGRAVALQADSADPQAVQRSVDQAAEALGRLDILVNNAGVAPFAPVDTFSMEEFDRAFAINVRAVFAATQQAAKHLPEGGRVINIGSVNAERMPVAGGSVYAMTKAAVAGLTRGLARDLGPRNITVNALQPGPVDTDMNPASGPFADTLRSFMAIPRYAEAEEIAGMVAYLAGPEARSVTGAMLTIDGGFLA